MLEGPCADVLSNIVAWDDSQVYGGCWGCRGEDVGEDDVAEFLGDGEEGWWDCFGR